MENLEKPGNQVVKIVIGIVIITLVVIFSLQNSESTIVKFIAWQGNAPLVLLFLLCFVLGLIFALFAILPVSRHSKRKSRMITELNARIDVLESQLKNQSKQNP
jgi:uncharacterized integral membrane protein